MTTLHECITRKKMSQRGVRIDWKTCPKLKRVMAGIRRARMHKKRPASRVPVTYKMLRTLVGSLSGFDGLTVTAALLLAWTGALRACEYAPCCRTPYGRLRVPTVGHIHYHPASKPRKTRAVVRYCIPLLKNQKYTGPQEVCFYPDKKLGEMCLVRCLSRMFKNRKRLGMTTAADSPLFLMTNGKALNTYTLNKILKAAAVAVFVGVAVLAIYRYTYLGIFGRYFLALTREWTDSGFHR